MAIGYPITQNSINSRAGALALRIRALAQDTNNFQAEVNTVTLTAVGFSAPDAAAMTTAVSYLGQLAGVYYGNNILFASPFNSDTALANLRGLGGQG